MVHRSEEEDRTTTDTTTREVSFDILLKGRMADTSRTPQMENIEQFKPTGETIERSRRWLLGEGVRCHPTEFGLACTAPVELFERLFQVRLEERLVTPGGAPFGLSGEPVAPEPIADWVDQITLTVAPELF